MPSLNCEAYVCNPRPNYPLLITAKRYWLPQEPSDDPDAVTLVFAHGTGHHKEHWEPTIQHLYDHAHAQGGVQIRDVWAIDAPNHGDAAVLNEHTLRWGYPIFSWQEYARSVHIFLSGLGTGIDVDFGRRKLVAVGHSMGAIAMMLAGTYAPTLKFSSILLVDPMLMPPPPRYESGRLSKFLLEGAQKRRDIWPSRADALAGFQSRPAFKAWDPRVLKIYVEQGLRELPSAEYPDKTEGVTLKCTKAQEYACYAEIMGRARAFNLLPHLCETVHVHFIYGAVDDYLPRDLKDYVVGTAQGKQASVRRVDGAGHLVPQMQPRGLADTIWAVLQQDASRDGAVLSKL
ncbi:Alpha/beta hydrolase fold-1 [Amylocystis lapponica]|nr:Alpha/beta hydrolase fold-1 [Amylocystis lapponica]